jgi:hypothetical protein
MLHSPSGNTVINIVGYYLYKNGIKMTIGGPTTKNTWTFTNLDPGTSYTLSATSRDSLYNESCRSQLVAATTCSAGNCSPPPSGELEKMNFLISVSPNPASENITLNIYDGERYNISIISITGLVVLEKQNVLTQESVDISNLAKGIYIIQAKGENKIYKTKLAIE